MKVAFLIQRYGTDLTGGAEVHCRYIAEHLAKHWDVEVWTTCAKDYITWRNEYREGLEKINDIPVRRFRVSKERNPIAFGRLQENLLNFAHTEEEELAWIEEEGPNSPDLIRYLKRKQDEWDFFIFFSYRYYHSFHGIQAVRHKSILVPTAEPDPTIHFSIFKEFFNMPRGFIYNSTEEKRMINALSGNYTVPGDIVGVGSEIPAKSNAADFRKKYSIDSPFLLYIGRVDENKGCGQLFDFMRRYRAECDQALKLVLIGHSVMKVPADAGIVYLGPAGDEDKFNALSASELLVMPSFYESLSMVLLEAWGMGKPTLANGNCRVLMGQSIRSNAGLFYTDYTEFKRCLLYLKERPHLRSILGHNGRRFYDQNYRWDIIERKYVDLVSALKQ